MRTILFIVQKEFRQIFRHRTMLPILFLMPFVQLLILPHAADYEVRNINLQVVDRDASGFSRQLISQFEASDHFRIVAISDHKAPAIDAIERGEADLFLEIPPYFERDLLRDQHAQLQLSIDAINGAKAGLAQQYAQAIVLDFNQDILVEWLPRLNLPPAGATPRPIDITYSNWFNPGLDYDTFMVPGILVLLITMIGGFLSGMNIVKEKEIGTIEQINVSPIRKYQFIVGKLLPFWIIALVDLGLGLIIGKLVFHIPIVGSLGLIFGFAAVYLLLVLGIGLLISTVTETQQQSMFITWFLLVIFILMSGLFTPIESMPPWAQQLTRFNPIAYFVEVIRLVLLKGSSFADIQRQFFTVQAFAGGTLLLAVWNYRKTA